MKTIIYFTLIGFLMTNVLGVSFGKTNQRPDAVKPKFVMGEISENTKVQSCSYYTKKGKNISYITRLQGMKQFLTKKDEDCFLDIVAYLKALDSQTTQVHLNNLFVEMENYQTEKQLIVKAFSFFSKDGILPIVVENMLAHYNKSQQFQSKEVALKDYSLYVEKIEEFYKLRFEIAKTIALLTESNPRFMKDYSDEIRSGFTHPIYKDLDEKLVGDADRYNRDVETFLGMALKIIDGKVED